MWKCPECGSERLEVTVECSALLIQHDAEQFETETYADGLVDNSHHWDENSTMMCLACVHVSPADDFEVED